MLLCCNHAAAERRWKGSQRCTPFDAPLVLLLAILHIIGVQMLIFRCALRADKLAETKRAEKEIRDTHKKELHEKKAARAEVIPLFMLQSPRSDAC